MQQQPQQFIANHVSSPPVPTARPNRLLYRRGLPDLPELIEHPEEDEITATDDISTNTFSTRHSTSTSVSSRDFPMLTMQSASPKMQVPRHFPELTPPGSTSQLQGPFEYISSNNLPAKPPFREVSPPPSPREENLENMRLGFGLGLHLPPPSGTYLGQTSGMVDDQQSGISSDIYGTEECALEDCPQCSGLSSPYHISHQLCCSSGEVPSSEVGDYISPPSSPGTDCTCQDLGLG